MPTPFPRPPSTTTAVAVTGDPSPDPVSAPVTPRDAPTITSATLPLSAGAMAATRQPIGPLRSGTSFNDLRQLDFMGGGAGGMLTPFASPGPEAGAMSPSMELVLGGPPAVAALPTVPPCIRGQGDSLPGAVRRRRRVWHG